VRLFGLRLQLLVMWIVGGRCGGQDMWMTTLHFLVFRSLGWEKGEGLLEGTVEGDGCFIGINFYSVLFQQIFCWYFEFSSLY